MQRTIDGESSGSTLFSPLDPTLTRPVPGVSFYPPNSRRSSNRLVAVALGALVVVQAVFALVWISATHSPEPHRIPLAIAAADTTSATELADALNAIGTHPVAAKPMTTEAANVALHSRAVDAVLMFGTGPSSDTLYVAGAAGPAESQLLSTSLGALDAGRNRKLQTVDAVALPAADINGLAPFSFVLSWIAAGILGAVTVAGLAGRAAASRQDAIRRVAGLAGYALACSLVTTASAEAFYGVAKGQLAATTIAGLAVVFATACATGALRSLTSTSVTVAVLTAFLAVGIPAGGGLVPHHLLPAALRAIGPYLLTGAGVDLVRNVLYFGHHGVGGPWTIVFFWAVAGAGLLIVSTTRAQRQNATVTNGGAATSNGGAATTND